MHAHAYAWFRVHEGEAMIAECVGQCSSGFDKTQMHKTHLRCRLFDGADTT